MIDAPEPGSAAWREKVLANAENIYVRVQVDGRWQTAALATLSPEEQEKWIERWASDLRSAP